MKLFQGRQDKAITSDSNRVPQCNGSTVDVEPGVFQLADGFGPPEFLFCELIGLDQLHTSQNLSCKCFVDLNKRHLIQLHAGFFENL